MNDREKLDAFARKVIGKASERAAERTSEAHEQKSAALETRKKDIDARIKAKYEQLYENDEREISVRRSREALERNKKYLSLRDTLTDEVLSRTEGMVRDFAAGEDYPGYLCALARSAAELFGGEYTAYVKGEDMRFADMIKESAGKMCLSVECDESIRIGGAKFRAVSGELLINGTLEESIARSRENLALMMGKYLRTDE